MELKEAIEKLKEIKKNCRYKTYVPNEQRDEWKQESQAIDTVLEELNNRISKEILEEYLTQAEEGYKIYKEASKENGGCKGGMWRYLGQVDVLKRILGKSIKIVTLDKE